MPQGIGAGNLDAALSKAQPVSHTGVFLGFDLRAQLVSANRIAMKLYQAIENPNCIAEIPTLDDKWPVDGDHDLGLEEWRFKSE